MSYLDRSMVTHLAATELQDADDRALAAARDSLPGWRILEVFGGYAAVPSGVELVQSTTLDGLVLKLRQQDDAQG